MVFKDRLQKLTGDSREYVEARDHLLRAFAQRALDYPFTEADISGIRRAGETIRLSHHRNALKIAGQSGAVMVGAVVGGLTDHDFVAQGLGMLATSGFVAASVLEFAGRDMCHQANSLANNVDRRT